ncbi:MAG: hypothetical protein ACTHW3_07585 [Leucobacter sp.]
MARTWLSVSVELLGGRGEDLWPRPGRIFAVGPSHTFEDLAEAINVAFARWDMSHISEFTLADGTLVSDPDSGLELLASIGGPISLPLDISTTKVARTLKFRDEFQFIFDLGDGWTHRCVIEDHRVDPVEVLGIRPKKPLAYWGWGAIPDQYGRRWSHDDGKQKTPRRPAHPHPMLTHEWPEARQLLPLDLSEVRRAIIARDPSAFLASITGREIDHALQQTAVGAPLLLQNHSHESDMLVLSFVNRLNGRAYAGDAELAEDLLTLLRAESLPGRPVPADLEMLAAIQEGDPDILARGVRG